MWLNESRIALSVSLSAVILSIRFIYKRKELNRVLILTILPILVLLLHFTPILLPLFISISSNLRKPIKAILYIISAALGICTMVIFSYDNSKSIITTVILSVYVILTVSECLFYFIKWYTKKRRRDSLRRRPVVKRRFGNEIRMPPISVRTEVRHLRTKSDFIINGVVYIRKGETVELLKTIGSYYSVRNSSGTEYIVPKANFF